MDGDSSKPYDSEELRDNFNFEYDMTPDSGSRNDNIKSPESSVLSGENHKKYEVDDQAITPQAVVVKPKLGLCRKLLLCFKRN